MPKRKKNKNLKQEDSKYKKLKIETGIKELDRTVNNKLI
jgi:hypothetical protein